MSATDDRCPECRSHDVNFEDHDDLPDTMSCGNCGHEGEAYTFWPTRAELGLSATNCEACNARLSFGCGHSHEQELAALVEQATVEHQSGACTHYDHTHCNPEHCAERATVVHWHPPAGYAPFVTHREQAMKYGAADPHTGEAFTSAQRQHWIETGKIIEVADTFA